MKIICAGLGKTGTKSLAKALRILGFTVLDYDEHINLHLNEWIEVYCEGKMPNFASMYKDVDAVVDFSPSFWFEEIYETFPDAKVVLSVRDSEEVWVQSWIKENEVRKSLGGLLNRVLLKWPLVIKPWIRGKHHYFELIDAIVASLYGSLNSKSTAIFKKKYREHNERVQAVIPKEKLLIYNVKQGWKPLCEFIECAVPEVEFPRENIASSFARSKIAAGRRQINDSIIAILTAFALLVGMFYLLFK